MIYLEHFGLREAPFRITPHTDFFFAGANRGATLEALIYAIRHDEGIVKVSGEVGSGKTMLCRMLLENLPASVETVYLANPLLSRDEILFAIADELRLPLADERGHPLLRALQDRLLTIYASGRQVVALIDEAHAMPPEALEEIRLLSNLESNQHKLLQIVLFGQPELDQRLAETRMRQLNDRITHHFRLQPLPRRDVGAYLTFRLRAAGYRGPELFSDGAIRLIGQASQGLTRRINILADKALLAAFSDNAYRVDRRHVRAAVGDAGFNPLGRRFRDAGGLWAGAVAVVCLVAGLAYFAGSHYATARLKEAAASASPPSPANVAPVTAEPAVAPSAVSPGKSGALDKPVSLAERIAATEAWLQTTPDHHYFIQLLVTDAGSQREVLDFMANSARSLDPQQIRVYRSRVAGRDRLGVIYGDYSSRDEANAALATLTQISPASQPYVREVGRLRPPRLAEGPKTSP